MNKNRGFTPLAVVLMLSGSLALTGCDDKQAQQGGQQMPAVGVVTVKTEPLQITTELPGRTSAYRIAEVRPQVSGIILKRNFKEGSDIEAGVSLYQIDPATYQATYDSAKGDLAKAQAAANIAQLTVNRYQKLLGTQYISKQEYDQALADAQQANAAVTAAKAAVETARINLAYTKVTSPISGRIGKSNVTEGALVQNGQATALATVQQLDPIYVDVTQSSNDFLRLKQELANGTLKQENGKAKVSLITSDGIKFPQDGTLEFSDVTVDQTTGSITLRAIFPNPDHTLLPGMFVRARLEEGLNPNAILSAFVLAIVVLGGMGSQFAVILAAILLVVSRELMRDFNEYSMLMLGGLMVLMMIWRPQGLLPMTRPQLKLKNGAAKGEQA